MNASPVERPAHLGVAGQVARSPCPRLRRPSLVSTEVCGDASRRSRSRDQPGELRRSSRSLATRIATLRASWSAAAMARSSARVRTSRHSGMTKATTTADVVARTSHEIRLRIRPLGAGSTSRTPDPADADQVARLGGRLAELATQPRQVDVDGPVGAAVRLLPDLGEQLALGDHLARPRGPGRAAGRTPCGPARAGSRPG